MPKGNECVPRFAIRAVRAVRLEDSADWDRLRRALWPEGAVDHADEIAAFFAGTLLEPVAVLLAEAGDGEMIGLAELSIRPHLPGLDTQRIGYVEGLYVVPEVRGRGVAVALLRECRSWARERGCTAFASDRAGRIAIDLRF